MMINDWIVGLPMFSHNLSDKTQCGFLGHISAKSPESELKVRKFLGPHILKHTHCSPSCFETYSHYVAESYIHCTIYSGQI